MSNLLERLQSLSGLNPKQLAVDKLIAERAEINSAYENAILAARRNEPLNEGLFSALKVALSTASNFGKAAGGAVATSVAAKVKSLASSVVELYKDAKAAAELDQLIKEMNSIIKNFEDVEKAAPTILSRDPAIKKSIGLFSDLMKNTALELSARQASAKGITEAVDIEKMLKESIDLKSYYVCDGDTKTIISGPHVNKAEAEKVEANLLDEYPDAIVLTGVEVMADNYKPLK